MAWLIGKADKDEIASLEKRGWTVTDFTADMALDILAEAEDDLDRMVFVYVDNDLEKIMSGPDWEKEKILTFSGLAVGEHFTIDHHAEPRTEYVKIPRCEDSHGLINAAAVSPKEDYPILVGVADERVTRVSRKERP